MTVSSEQLGSVVSKIKSCRGEGQAAPVRYIRPDKIHQLIDLLKWLFVSRRLYLKNKSP